MLHVTVYARQLHGEPVQAHDQPPFRPEIAHANTPPREPARARRGPHAAVTAVGLAGRRDTPAQPGTIITSPLPPGETAARLGQSPAAAGQAPGNWERYRPAGAPRHRTPTRGNQGPLGAADQDTRSRARLSGR
jgi:hypothetical protein